MRAWISDILFCIEELNKNEFKLRDIYDFEEHLSKIHSNNNNIKAKIRQQLQILRNRGILEFKSSSLTI